MSGVLEHLRERRKAELQGIHQFWFPGASMLTTREELESRIAEALTGCAQLRDKLARLTRTQTTLLTTLIGQPEYKETCDAVLAALEGKGMPEFEVESSARMLIERGFLTRRRTRGGGARGEFYQIPAELGAQLEDLFEVGGTMVPPEDQLSQKRLPFEVDFEDLDAPIEGLSDPQLRQLVRLAIEHCGLVERPTPGVDAIIGDGQELLQRPWKDALEEAGIGTIGPVSLKDFGIIVEEPALIIFQEWIQRRCREELFEVEEPDTVLESGVDLYTDIYRLAIRLEMKPARLTREGRVPKRVFESLRSSLCLPRIEAHFEGDPVEAVMQIALALGIVETYGDQLRVHGERLTVWRKLDLTRQVEIIRARFLAEHQGIRWSFHQEALRQILNEVLGQERPGGWVSLETLVSLVVSTYLLELEERDVRGILRQRREEDFARERLNTPFHRLGSDLTYWIVHRFLLLGVCELGYRDGRLSAFRLTALGKELLGLESDGGENRILVNPNFEIILFREGLRGMRLELALSRFGERISAERIRRYHVTRDTMRQGIRSGLAIGEILKLLEDASEHPLPEPVLMALKDWGKDLDWVHAQPAILLQGLKAGRAQELVKFLKSHRCRHQVCADHSVVLSEDQSASKLDNVAEILDRLRDEGWLIRESPEPESESYLEDLEPRSA